MTTILPSELDIEHWSSDQDTGPLRMFNAMQAATTTAQWSNRAKSVAALVAWWTNVSSYDPDLVPERLMKRPSLSVLSQEVLGIAAVHRVRPGGLCTEVPTPVQTQEWLKSSSAQTLRSALEMDKTSLWWERCLFEGLNPVYRARTEHLVVAVMPDHHFVHMANTLNLPLHEMLPMLDSEPSFFIPHPFVPGVADLC